MAAGCPLSAGGASPAATDEADQGASPLHELLTLVANDDAEGMAAALNSGAKWSAAEIGSPLHAAATYGAGACVKRLLADGAAVDEPNKDSHTPLHLATVEGSPSVLGALLAAKADPMARTRDVRVRLMSGGLAIDLPGGRTALHLAAAHANLEAARLLLEACPKAREALDHDGATPLDAALREGARGRRGPPPPARLALAELLAPGGVVPTAEELRAAEEVAAAGRRQRGDVAERTRKAALEEALRDAALPAARGYEPGDLELHCLAAAGLQELLCPKLAQALELPEGGARREALDGLVTEITPGVHAFRLFPASGPEDGLGERLLKELTAIEAWARASGWALKRPNSMNRYGVVLREVGLEALVSALATAVVAPMAGALWHNGEAGEGAWDDLHAFTVRYRGGEDRRLDTHMDSSEVTLNVCLGGNFSGGGVYFHGLRSEDDSDPMTSPHPADCPFCRVNHPHEPGIALLHLGEHVHGAHNIEAGERTNLVLWCRKKRPET